MFILEGYIQKFVSLYLFSIKYLILTVLLSYTGYSLDDCGQRCVRSVPRRGQLYANRQSGAEETGLFVPHELCQVSAGHGHHGCQYFC